MTVFGSTCTGQIPTEAAFLASWCPSGSICGDQSERGLAKRLSQRISCRVEGKKVSKLCSHCDRGDETCSLTNEAERVPGFDGAPATCGALAMLKRWLDANQVCAVRVSRANDFLTVVERRVRDERQGALFAVPLETVICPYLCWPLYLCSRRSLDILCIPLSIIVDG